MKKKKSHIMIESSICKFLLLNPQVTRKKAAVLSPPPQKNRKSVSRKQLVHKQATLMRFPTLVMFNNDLNISR